MHTISDDTDLIICKSNVTHCFRVAMKSKSKYLIVRLIQKSSWLHLFLASCIIIGFNWDGFKSSFGSFDAIDCRSLDFREKLWAEKEAREGRAVVMFTHIHKSGGSTICSFAEKRGMSVNMINNCNVGNKTEQVHFALSTLQARKQIIKQLGHGFVALEFDSMPTDSWFDENSPQIVHIITMRHPFSRLRSQYSWVSNQYRQKYKTQELPKKLRSFESYVSAIVNLKGKKYHDIPDAEVPIEWLDNLVVRQLAGHDAVYSVPVGEVTEDHFETAKQALSKFSAILILENLPETIPLLTTKIGWQDAEDMVDIRTRELGGGSSTIENDITRLMHRVEQYDLKLYNYAARLLQKCHGINI